jgi:hypothetical protein
MDTNPNLTQVLKVNPDLALLISNRGGFITDDQMEELIGINRMMLVMVRCGMGRFICPIQDAKHFIDIIERDSEANNGHQGEHIRDVSLTHNVMVDAEAA